MLNISEEHAGQPLLPDACRNQAGSMRRVGVEIEFCGLDLPEIAACIEQCVGGTLAHINEYEAAVRDTRLGDVGIVLDALLFRDLKLRHFFDGLPLHHINADLSASMEKLLASEAKRVVPFEVVFEPIAIDRLNDLEVVRQALGQKGKGTAQSIFYAFGLHLNPELPVADLATTLRYFRAFLVLYEALKQAHEVDLSRRFLPFIDPFPLDYVLLVLDEDYKPDLNQFIDDYVAASPTRNRPMDLLPVLKWLNEARVNRLLPGEKISKRPALHYRLPNSQVDESQWSVVLEWNRWMMVERLAADAQALSEAMADERHRLNGGTVQRVRQFWRRWRR